MDSCLTSKKKELNVSDVIKQYSNLNLNEYSNVYPINTKSITYDCKKDSKIGLINSNESQTKKANNLWNHNQKNPSPNYLNMLGNSENKELKIGNKFTFSKNATNNSTLHISAYENSVDATALDSYDDKNDKTSNKQTMVKNWRNAKEFFIESPWTIQNPFEFPRQQSDKVSKPEVSQFRASQHLYNPNGTNSTTTTTTTNEQNVDSSAATNQIGTEENVNESRSHIDTIDTENPFYRAK
uniref:Uncharacterized protein n=1 Tax=Panagrolaimus sp. PS1159 TaxID=55785 RepID=A0AC35GJ84_9BILA